jgi:hypothetical protein
MSSSAREKLRMALEKLMSLCETRLSGEKILSTTQDWNLSAGYDEQEAEDP